MTNNIINTPLITLGGAFTMTGGSFTFTGTLTGNTSVIFPTSGTLVSTIGGVLPLSQGGTNANLTASNGGIFYSTATAGAILSGTATANQVLLSGATAAPSWSLATYPSSTTANNILYSVSGNVIGQIAAAASGVLVTDVSSVPSISSTLPADVQANITSVGTITSGIWNGTIITGQYGGTGVNNSGKTITLGGSFTTSGAFSPTLAFSASNTYTFPTAAQTMLGLLGGSLSGSLYLVNSTPATSLEAASKGYVDSIASGFTIVTAAVAATTADRPAVYANGAAGVGATLTNSGAMVAFSTDGVSPNLNDRVLVKSQTAPAENGVYTLTTVGSGAVNWVLTRATDYDTAAEVLPGTIVPVTSGTTLAASTWLQYDTVVTMGTDPIQFSQYSVSNPVTLASGGTSANLTASAGSVVYSTASAMAFTAVGSSGQLLSSAGTGTPIWTSSAYPSSSGVVGKILISDGTNFVASTPTYPNASVTAGKIIISDGTNYIASTSLFPNTVGVAGKILISDGTINTYSTPTYPNASVTAGKIIISDGTNYLASTSIFPNTVGTVGKILRSDGTINTYTTSTFADTYAVNTILYASSANVIVGLATVNSSILTTSAGGVPTWLANLTVPMGGTGDSSFTAYAVICGGITSTDPLQNVSGVGTLGQVLTSGGAGALPTWQTMGGGSNGFNQIAIQSFYSSGTYTPTANMKYCVIECVGSGGGSGGATSTGSSTYASSGGGGGGSYARKIATAADIGASQVVTIGAGGTAGSAGGANAGGNGGDVSVGVLCIGKGGTGSPGSDTQTGGAGGLAGTGDFVIPGGDGGGGYALSVISVPALSGAGGSSFFAPPAPAAEGGFNGSLYGGGASGGMSFNFANVVGFAGGKGVVIITEYLSI